MWDNVGYSVKLVSLPALSHNYTYFTLGTMPSQYNKRHNRLKASAVRVLIFHAPFNGNAT